MDQVWGKGEIQTLSIVRWCFFCFLFTQILWGTLNMIHIRYDNIIIDSFGFVWCILYNLLMLWYMYLLLVLFGWMGLRLNGPTDLGLSKHGLDIRKMTMFGPQQIKISENVLKYQWIEKEFRWEWVSLYNWAPNNTYSRFWRGGAISMCSICPGEWWSDFKRTKNRVISNSLVLHKVCQKVGEPSKILFWMVHFS